jgi:hypothetical protein
MTKHEKREAGLLTKETIEVKVDGTEKVLDDDYFWSIADAYESEHPRGNKTMAAIDIGEAYTRLGKTNPVYLDQAFADVNLLLNGEATIRQYNYLKKNYFCGK